MKITFIDKIHFFEFGKTPPEHISRFRSEMSTGSLIELSEYLDRSEAKQNKYNENNFFTYVSSRPGATTTHSSFGVLDSVDKTKAFNTEISKSFSKEGHLFWSTVISLPDRETAVKYQLLKTSDWELLLQKIFPKFCRAVNLDFKNMHYFLNMHVNTKHPHVHFVFMEKNQTRTRGKFPQSKINLLNELIAKQLMKQVETKEIKTEHATYFKTNDQLKQKIIHLVQERINVDNGDVMQHLFENLPQTGRMQLNSFHLKDFKTIILSYANELLLHPEVKSHLLEFQKRLQTLDAEKSKLSNQEYTSMYNSEMKKLQTQIANRIVKEIKKRRVQQKIKMQSYTLNCHQKIVYQSGSYDRVKTKIRIPYTKKYFFIANENLKKTKNNMYEITLLKNQGYSVFNAETCKNETLTGEEVNKMFEQDKYVYDIGKDLEQHRSESVKIMQKFISATHLIKETKSYCYFRVGNSTAVVQIPKHFIFKANRAYYTIKYPSEHQFKFAAKGGKQIFRATLNKFDEIKQERKIELQKIAKRRKMVNSTYDVVMQLLNMKKQYPTKKTYKTESEIKL